jgi:aspartate carbamoyltransferase catalytic subunit
MDILTVANLPNDTLVQLFQTAEGFRHKPPATPRLLNKIIGCLFFESSTRTRLSFESATYRLGGSVLSAHDSESLSITKGETLIDTVLTVSAYVDVLVIRSAQDYHSWFDSRYPLPVPVINAGDGGNNHPTQALLDAYTVWRQRGQPNTPIPIGVLFGIAGDVAKSRTIRSFVELMSRECQNHFIVYDTTNRDARLPFTGNITYVDRHVFEQLLPTIDYLYLNRIQKERHLHETNSHFQLTLDHLRNSNMIVLNPGPRREELPDDVCHHPQVKMWEQVRDGLYVRMALLDMVSNL